jgi:hypothetical protein
VLNGPYARVLKERQYLEMNDEIAEQLNTCWVSTPQFKYFSSKLLAGAILFNEETGQSLLLTSVEVYGRTSIVDPHCENPDATFPPQATRYSRIWPMSLKSNDGLKLIIGTDVSNFLVTGSIRVDAKVSAEAGPSTLNWKLETEQASASTLIFIDKKMYAAAKTLGENFNCNGVDRAHSLYQLRQIRSKFGEIQTYDRIRSTVDMFNVTKQQPISIFTLCNQRKAVDSNGSENPANYILASKLFANIAGEVLAKKYKAMLTKDATESILLQFKNKQQHIPTIISKILDLFEDSEDQIRILHNHDLNRHLVNLASQLAPYITKANAEVIKNVNNKMEQRQ